MAHATEIDDLLEHVNALERCAVALAREQENAPRPQRGWSAAATHEATHAMRETTRRFPLLALAAAFGLGLYAASRFDVGAELARPRRA